MASKRSGSKAKSGGRARARKGKATMGSLKDLEAKDSQKIRGGDKSKSGRADFANLSIMKVLDKTTPL